MRSGQRGFKLTHLLIVVALAAILAVAIGVPSYQGMAMRDKVTAMINVAAACKASVAKYYQAHGVFPGNETQAGCSSEGAEDVRAPKVGAMGEVTVSAAGTLATQIKGGVFGFKPMTAGAGQPITAWACSAALGAPTTIEQKYLPAACR